MLFYPLSKIVCICLPLLFVANRIFPFKNRPIGSYDCQNTSQLLRLSIRFSEISEHLRTSSNASAFCQLLVSYYEGTMFTAVRPCQLHQSHQFTKLDHVNCMDQISSILRQNMSIVWVRSGHFWVRKCQLHGSDQVTSKLEHLNWMYQNMSLISQNISIAGTRTCHF